MKTTMTAMGLVALMAVAGCGTEKMVNPKVSAWEKGGRAEVLLSLIHI